MPKVLTFRQLGNSARRKSRPRAGVVSVLDKGDYSRHLGRIPYHNATFPQLARYLGFSEAVRHVSGYMDVEGYDTCRLVTSFFNCKIIVP